MSDTPICDSEAVGFDDETQFHLGRTVWYVPAELARQLERDLNQQLKINQQLALRLNSYERGHIVGSGTIPFSQ